MESQDSSGSKRQRLETSPFTTTNRFTPLQNMENETESDQLNVSNNQNKTQTNTKELPPPIFIHNITNMNALILELKRQNVGPYKHITISSNKVKFNFETIDGYRLAVKYLTATNAEFYTFQMKTEKRFRVVVRGLHPSCDVEMMMEEIKEIGFNPVQMTPVYHPITKVPCPMFFLDLLPDPNNEKIYDVKRLYGAVVHVEPPKPKRTIIQCMKCQEFGHTKNYCYKTPRCVKCDGMHDTAECRKDPKEPPVCVNCKGPHTANYRGCPVHKKLQSVMPYNLKRTENVTANKPVENKSQAPPHHTSNSSYADAVQHSENNNENYMINKLIEKVDSLLSVILPLINTLQQIIPVLINKK